MPAAHPNLARGRIAALLATAAGIAGAAGCAHAQAERPGAGAATPPAATPTASAPRTLRVSGEGRASAAPDLALVTVGVTALDRSLAAAQREANERAARILAALRAAGVAPGDVQTSRYEVQLERRQDRDRPSDPPAISGYRVSNALRVKVRDLARLGPLLDRLVGAGANDVQSLELTKDDTAPELARALAGAVRSARAKAEEMARAAGLALGDLLELRELSRGGGPVAPFARAMSAAAVPIAEGQVEVVAEVEAVFALR